MLQLVYTLPYAFKGLYLHTSVFLGALIKSISISYVLLVLKIDAQHASIVQITSFAYE